MASLLQVKISAMYLMFFSQNFIILNIFLFPLVNAAFSPSALPSPKQQNGFVARLIHRTSSESPFYNRHATPEDLMREDIRTSQKRSLYLGQLMRGEKSMKIAKAPISNEFVMNFSIGTPPQQTYAIPDTGSSLTWLQCNPCESCYNQKIPLYQRKNSMSYKEVLCAHFDCYSQRFLDCRPDGACSYEMSYGDASFSRGIIATETFTFAASGFTGSITLENLYFGCGTNNKMTSNMPFPGIVGLGTNDVSLIVQKRYPSFSYCTISDFRGDVEGWIHFGSESQLFGRSTPLLTSPANDFYRLSFQGISVDGEDLKLPKKVFDKGFIIDSGTTYTLLNTDAFDMLIEALKSAMPDENVWSIYPWELCFKNIDNDPEINFNFEDLSFPLRLRNTWLRVSDVYCLAIRRTTDFSVFGMFQQRGVNVGYDLENKQLRLKYVDYCPDDDDDEYN